MKYIKFTESRNTLWQINVLTKNKKSLEPEQEPSDKNELFHWILTLAIAVIIALCVNRFVLVNAEIPSGSMENTIMTGDRVFGNRLAYIFGEPKRFDIIIFRYPDDEKQLFIKRIIGLPGETVEIHDGQIFIDGSKTPLKDVTTKEFMQGSFGPYTVPDNCYFVMGDNRASSADSRYHQDDGDHGLVPIDNVVGVGLMRYWPLNRMSFLSSHHDVFKDVPAGKAQ